MGSVRSIAHRGSRLIRSDLRFGNLSRSTPRGKGMGEAGGGIVCWVTQIIGVALVEEPVKDSGYFQAVRGFRGNPFS